MHFTVHFSESEEERFFRRRTRVSLDGQFCAHLEEKEACITVDDECPVYNWTTGQWSECALAEDLRCGYGLRVRGLHSRYEYLVKRVFPTISIFFFRNSVRRCENGTSSGTTRLLQNVNSNTFERPTLPRRLSHTLSVNRMEFLASVQKKLYDTALSYKRVDRFVIFCNVMK